MNISVIANFIENQLSEQMKEIQERDEKWKEMDEIAEKIFSINSEL
jgi:hypothetical protein